MDCMLLAIVIIIDNFTIVEAIFQVLFVIYTIYWLFLLLLYDLARSLYILVIPNEIHLQLSNILEIVYIFTNLIFKIGYQILMQWPFKVE